MVRPDRCGSSALSFSQEALSGAESSDQMGPSPECACITTFFQNFYVHTVEAMAWSLAAYVQAARFVVAVAGALSR